MADNFNQLDRADGVQVSPDDTTPDLLDQKIVAGANITINTLNPGGDEQLEIVGGGGGGGGFAPYGIVQSGNGFTLTAASLYAIHYGFTAAQISSFTLPNTTGLSLANYPIGGYTIVQVGTAALSVSLQAGITVNQGGGITFSSVIKQVTVVRASATNWIVG